MSEAAWALLTHPFIIFLIVAIAVAIGWTEWYDRHNSH